MAHDQPAAIIQCSPQLRHGSASLHTSLNKGAPHHPVPISPVVKLGPWNPPFHRNRSFISADHIDTSSHIISSPAIPRRPTRLLRPPPSIPISRSACSQTLHYHRFVSIRISHEHSYGVTALRAPPGLLRRIRSAKSKSTAGSQNPRNFATIPNNPRPPSPS